MSQVFYFRRFQLVQEVNAMKVGTDSVLLGATTTVKNVENVLDVGAGTGIMSLMIAQRSAAMIDAIEIDEENSRECLSNISASPWHDRINVLNVSYQSYAPGKRYELIISNPPYFSGSLLSQNDKRNLARHQQSLSMIDFIDHSTRLLTPNGRLTVILPAEQGQVYLEEAENKGLHCERLLKVYGRSGKKEIRWIMEHCFNRQPVVHESIVIEHNGRHEYTREYLDLVKDFLFLE